jgi:Uma2 family endonuclease
MPQFYHKENRPFTYKDIISKPENERWELIDGIPFLQARPSDTHQRALRELLTQFHSFLRGKSCEVFSEFPVWLDNEPEDLETNQYLVPDLLINCDSSKVAKNGIKGAPEMIIEILSASTASVDKIKKFRKYQESGVKEYWIVEPDQKLISVFKLDMNGKYSIINTYDEGQVEVGVLPGLVIDLNLVFPVEG